MKEIVKVQKVNVRTVSKSALNKNFKCSALAYLGLRDTSYQIGSKQMDIGSYAHELAAKMVSEMYGITRFINNPEDRYSIEVIFEVENSISDKFLSCYGENIQLIGVEESSSIQVDEIEKNFRINSRFDAISRATINGQKYIIVDDFKTGFQISTEVDIEAIVYAYVTYREYDLPVIFRRISLNTGKTWSHEFSIESIEKIAPTLIKNIKKYKEDMESEYIPEYTPGSHCLYCPYIAKCQGRKTVETLNQKLKASIWAKQYAKFRETEVKNAATTVLNENMYNPEDGVLIPFVDNKYGAKVSHSESFQLAKRSLKKSDIIKLLISTGEIDEFINCLDIKIDEKLSERLSLYGIPMKKVVTSKVALIENLEKEDPEDE